MLRSEPVVASWAGLSPRAKRIRPGARVLFFRREQTSAAQLCGPERKPGANRGWAKPSKQLEPQNLLVPVFTLVVPRVIDCSRGSSPESFPHSEGRAAVTEHDLVSQRCSGHP